MTVAVIFLLLVFKSSSVQWVRVVPIRVVWVIMFLISVLGRFIIVRPTVRARPSALPLLSILVRLFVLIVKFRKSVLLKVFVVVILTRPLSFLFPKRGLIPVTL